MEATPGGIGFIPRSHLKTGRHRTAGFLCDLLARKLPKQRTLPATADHYGLLRYKEVLGY
jgi:hypothetical protein